MDGSPPARCGPLIAFLGAALLGAASGIPLAGADGGLGISPGLVLIQDAPLGGRLDLGSQGLRLVMSNGSAEPQAFTLAVSSPGPEQISAYEAGYEAIPDASWVKLEKTELAVPAHGTAASGIILDFPDRPELRNRHFMVYIEAGPALHAALGAVLHVRTRVLIETAVDAALAAGARPAEIAVAPGRVDMARGADGMWSGQLTIRNQGPATATYDLLPLNRAYGPGAEDHRARFFGGGQTGLTGDGWSAPDATSFTLEPGSSRIIHFSGREQRELRAGEMVDEVLFIARRAAERTPEKQRRRIADQACDRSELVRLRYQRQAAPAAGAKP